MEKEIKNQKKNERLYYGKLEIYFVGHWHELIFKIPSNKNTKGKVKKRLK